MIAEIRKKTFYSHGTSLVTFPDLAPREGLIKTTVGWIVMRSVGKIIM